MDVGKLLSGKKEKPMNLEAALKMIPDMFEQYLASERSERAVRTKTSEATSIVAMRRFAPRGAPLRTDCVEAKCAVIAFIANSLQQQQVHAHAAKPGPRHRGEAPQPGELHENDLHTKVRHQDHRPEAV